MPKLTEVTLETIAKGAAPEVFEHEFAKIIENIRDLNTDPEETRTLTLVFKVKPLKSREEARVKMESKVKLAATAPVDGHMFIGREVVTTHDTEQGDLLERQDVVDMESRRGAGASS